MAPLLAGVLKFINRHADDDMVDRLNYYYTGTLLVMLAILVSAKQYVGYPIQCWVPADFTEAMEQYTENFCWVKNTWFLRMNKPIPTSHDERDATQLMYYQWVPFILILMAVLFYVPCFIWRILNWQTGINVQDLVQMAKDSRFLPNVETRHQAVASLAYYFEDAITLSQERVTGSSLETKRAAMTSSQSGGRDCYLCVVYLCSKICYLLNIISQYFLLQHLLGAPHFFLGPWLFIMLLSGDPSQQWKSTGMFPRVTMCDFDIRVLGNLHRHSVQCVLVINMFNEKIFLFLWFWLGVLVILTVLSTLHYTWVLFFKSQREKFITKYLMMGDTDNEGIENNKLSDFVSRFLKADGVLVLRLMSGHCGDIVLAETICDLWQSFKDVKFHSRQRHLRSFRDAILMAKGGPDDDDDDARTQYGMLHTRAAQRAGQSGWSVGGRAMRHKVMAPKTIKHQKFDRGGMKKGQF